MLGFDADELRSAVDSAMRHVQARPAIAEIYADLSRQIDLRKPVCSMSGSCCRFEAFGHRLFVTTLELAVFALDRPAQPVAIADWDGTGCPYQIHGRCGVHPIRPFGCRIFFCDPTADAWQQEQYERLHRACAGT